jgi:hypothetical protein
MEDNVTTEVYRRSKTENSQAGWAEPSLRAEQARRERDGSWVEDPMPRVYVDACPTSSETREVGKRGRRQKELR